MTSLLILPALIVALAFFVLPIARLVLVGASGEDGLAAYASVLTNPHHREAMVSTVLLSASVTATTLALATMAALFLGRVRFAGRGLLVTMLTFPLASRRGGGLHGHHPGGAAGASGTGDDGDGPGADGAGLLDDGLFLGYLYFSIPRVLLTVMAGVEQIDPALPRPRAAWVPRACGCCAT